MLLDVGTHRSLRLLKSLSEATEGSALHVGGDVGVGIHGVRDLGVAEDLLHHLRVLSLLQHERGECVPQVVEAGGLGQAGRSAQGLVVTRGYVGVKEMFGDAVEAIQAAGFVPGHEVALAVDVAASHFYKDGRYHLWNGAPLSGMEMVKCLVSWLETYPISSIEDGLAEDDWKHWTKLRARVDGRALVLGDDLLCTNQALIERAISVNAADALLLKVNQIGTLTEAAKALQSARSAGWSVTVSARSGETEDDWLADLAVGWSAEQIKVGSITQSERLAKYNRLLEIESKTNLPLIEGKRPNALFNPSL